MNQELMILLIPLVRALLIVMLTVLVFFVFEGLREFRKFGPPKGKFRLRNLSWNDQPLTRLNSLIYSMLFFVGLGGAYGITVWAAALSHVGDLQNWLIAVWFIILTFSVGLLVFSFTRVLVLGGVLGYWLSWSVSQKVTARTANSDRRK